MIEGFQIEMTGQQLVAYLRKRADHHRDAAAECDLRREQAGSSVSPLDSGDPDRQVTATWPEWVVEEFDEHAARHRRRQAALLFLGQHVVANEIYRLDRSDMQFLEMWPHEREEQRS